MRLRRREPAGPRTSRRDGQDVNAPAETRTSDGHPVGDCSTSLSRAATGHRPQPDKDLRPQTRPCSLKRQAESPCLRIRPAVLGGGHSAGPTPRNRTLRAWLVAVVDPPALLRRSVRSSIRDRGGFDRAALCPHIATRPASLRRRTARPAGDRGTASIDRPSPRRHGGPPGGKGRQDPSASLQRRDPRVEMTAPGLARRNSARSSSTPAPLRRPAR